MRPFSAYRYGRRADVVDIVDIENETLSTSVSDPSDATTTLVYNSDGSISETSDSTLNKATWKSGGGAGSNYDIRVSPGSGTFSTGTVNTWLNLSGNRTWTVSRTTLGFKSCTATVEIRNATTLVVLDTATITLSATVESGA